MFVNFILTLITFSLIGILVAAGDCGLFNIKGLKRTDGGCGPSASGNTYQNIPVLDGVYCYNNGTGICKAFAGRFEFYFNVWNQEFLGPVEKGDYVDSYGYHERVPHAYMIDGQVLYADRPINWSRYFTKTKVKDFNLMSSTSFNWCKYVTSNNWPYKSSILDHDKLHRIYFFNRQSCIYNPETSELQHYNTRFLHTSELRIDLDYNPTIFAMEDNLANETRLVKHKRQHWYEVRWMLKKNPRPGLKYFVVMDKEEKQPLIVDGNGPLLRARMYNKTTDLCLSDFYGIRPKNGANARLVTVHCGLDKSEIADYITGREQVYEVGLHSIPRWPVDVERFYDVDVRDESAWERFASDGYSFSATTTIPHKEKNKYQVISLFSYFKVNAADEYDEHYPKTYLANYTVTNNGNNWSGVKNRKRDASTEMLNLNYVDDIAYLHTCDTILVIFGPLYTEFKQEQFNLNSKTQLGSIYDLGLNEMTSAFFAKDQNKLYFYHRMNFVAEHEYKCGSGEGALVTATRSKSYTYRSGPGADKMFPNIAGISYGHQEEKHFQNLGMFKGSLGPPEAPDAASYPWDKEEPEDPPSKSLPVWIYALIAICILVLLVMFILGFLAFRRIRRRRYLAMTQRSELPSLSEMSNQRTNRSAMAGGRASAAPGATVRSGKLRSSSIRPTATGRTSMSSGTSSQGTKRSNSLPKSHSRRSSSTKRSAMFSGSPESKQSSRRSGSRK